MIESPNRRRVALVVGSGGIKCAASLGLLRVLEREGIKIDLLVGCSGGSLYAAGIAKGLTVEECIEGNSRLLRPATFARKRLRSILQALLPSVFGFHQTFGLLDDAAINEVIREVFGDLTFAELKTPLYVVATDLHTSEKVAISSGYVRDAVRASIAIPLLLPPWEIEGHVLIDGGASDPLPIDVAIREGADVIIAMGFDSPLLATIPNASRLALQTSAITVNHLLRSTFAFYSLAHHAEVIPVMPMFDRPIGLTDAHLTDYIIRQGEIAAEREVPYLKKLLAATGLTGQFPVITG